MYQSFNATAIPASTEPFYFAAQSKQLPDSFTFKNDIISTQSFIEDSQTTGLLVLKNGKIEASTDSGLCFFNNAVSLGAETSAEKLSP